MRLSTWLLLTSCSVVLACSDSKPPSLELDTAPRCEASAAMCVTSEPRTFEVDGIRVLHQRIIGHPLVSLQIKFDVVEEPGGKQLWAEALALGILEWAGPDELGVVAWNARLAALNADVRTATGTDYRSLYAGVPLPHWRSVWNLLMDALERPTVDQDLLDQRRRIYQNAGASERDEPERAANVEAFARLFRGTLPNRGRESLIDLRNITLNDLRSAFVALRKTRRLLVTVVGDISTDELRARVHARKDALIDDHEPRFASATPKLGPSEAVVVLDFPESPTWHVRSAFLGPPPGTPDYAALELGLAVLDARLFDRVRDREGLAYTTGAQIAFYRQSYGRIWLTTDAPLEAFAIVREIVAELKSAGPEEEELERARQTSYEQLLLERTTPTALAFSLADWALTVGDVSGTDEHLATLAATSSAEVRDALTTYLKDVKTAAAGSGDAISDAELSTLYE